MTPPFRATPETPGTSGDAAVNKTLRAIERAKQPRPERLAEWLGHEDEHVRIRAIERMQSGELAIGPSCRDVVASAVVAHVTRARSAHLGWTPTLEALASNDRPSAFPSWLKGEAYANGTAFSSSIDPEAFGLEEGELGTADGWRVRIPSPLEVATDMASWAESTPDSGPMLLDAFASLAVRMVAARWGRGLDERQREALRGHPDTALELALNPEVTREDLARIRETIAEEAERYGQFVVGDAVRWIDTFGESVRAGCRSSIPYRLGGCSLASRTQVQAKSSGLPRYLQRGHQGRVSHSRASIPAPEEARADLERGAPGTPLHSSLATSVGASSAELPYRRYLLAAARQAEREDDRIPEAVAEALVEQAERGLEPYASISRTLSPAVENAVKLDGHEGGLVRELLVKGGKGRQGGARRGVRGGARHAEGADVSTADVARAAVGAGTLSVLGGIERGAIQHSLLELWRRDPGYLPRHVVPTLLSGPEASWEDIVAGIDQAVSYHGRRHGTMSEAAASESSRLPDPEDEERPAPDRMVPNIEDLLSHLEVRGRLSEGVVDHTLGRLGQWVENAETRLRPIHHLLEMLRGRTEDPAPSLSKASVKIVSGSVVDTLRDIRETSKRLGAQTGEVAPGGSTHRVELEKTFVNLLLLEGSQGDDLGRRVLREGRHKSVSNLAANLIVKAVQHGVDFSGPVLADAIRTTNKLTLRHEFAKLESVCSKPEAFQVLLESDYGPIMSEVVHHLAPVDLPGFIVRMASKDASLAVKALEGMAKDGSLDWMSQDVAQEVTAHVMAAGKREVKERYLTLLPSLGGEAAREHPGRKGGAPRRVP